MAGLFAPKVRVLNEIFRESNPNDFAVLVEPVAYEMHRFFRRTDVRILMSKEAKVSPKRSFIDLSKRNELLLCNHFTNLRPLTIEENSTKSHGIDPKASFHRNVEKT